MCAATDGWLHVARLRLLSLRRRRRAGEGADGTVQWCWPSGRQCDKKQQTFVSPRSSLFSMQPTKQTHNTSTAELEHSGDEAAESATCIFSLPPDSTNLLSSLNTHHYTTSISSTHSAAPTFLSPHQCAALPHHNTTSTACSINSTHCVYLCFASVYLHECHLTAVKHHHSKFTLLFSSIAVHSLISSHCTRNALASALLFVFVHSLANIH